MTDKSGTAGKLVYAIATQEWCSCLEADAHARHLTILQGHRDAGTGWPSHLPEAAARLMPQHAVLQDAASMDDGGERSPPACLRTQRGGIGRRCRIMPGHCHQRRRLSQACTARAWLVVSRPSLSQSVGRDAARLIALAGF